MKQTRMVTLLIVCLSLCLGLAILQGSQGQQKYTHNDGIDREDSPYGYGGRPGNPKEAPTGFDAVTNGFTSQAVFNANKDVFEEVEGVDEGLGPTFNATSCVECHLNVAVGGASQVQELRAGKVVNGLFEELPGGTLIHSRATYPEIVELVPPDANVRAFRISTNTLGDGFVEAISNGTLLDIRDSQSKSIRGVAVLVSVLEADNAERIGRFGWKSQHASLESFSADAYLNEMGITSPLQPIENTSLGNPVDPFDPTLDPEDDGEDVEAFANFMRATKAPPRGQITPAVQAGEGIFTSIGCAQCHVSSIVTAPAGTKINGGTFTVPYALGNKVIHPYSDFLLHDVGTGDGIPLNPSADITANRIRTAPLWGLRTRNRLMHDGLSFTRGETIVRHGGQAQASKLAYLALTASQKAKLLAFLDSL